MKTSATVAISAKADEMRAQGIRVYNFSTGDPVLRNHPLLIEAGQKVLEYGYSPYAPVAGLRELRIKAADWMNERYQSSFSMEEAIVTTGGKFSIYAALQILLKEGGEAIIAAPYWVSYPEMVRLASGTACIVQTRWKLTAEQLRKAINSKTKVLILNNACNPSGVLYQKEELEELLKIAATANLTVISDEVYSEIVYDGAKFISCASFPAYRSHTIVIESCSKNFAMAGWRVGFAFGPKQLIHQMIALQSQSTTGTSLMSQKLALCALQHAKEISGYVRKEMCKRRDLFFKTYNELFNTTISPSQSALYYFCKMKDPKILLEKGHIALVPGEAFGVEGYVRFAYSESEEEIVEGLKALAKFLLN